LVFQNQKKMMFDLDLNKVANTTIAGKDVNVEFNTPELSKLDLRRNEDQLVEIKLYIPGSAEANDEEDEEEGKTAAQAFLLV
jgi:hypothetical protein